MAELETTNTMLQGAFVKNGDGDFSLKTTGGGGGGSETVKIDPTGNTVKIDLEGNTVKITGEVVATSPQASNGYETIAQTGERESPLAANDIIAELPPLPVSGYYKIDCVVGVYSIGSGQYPTTNMILEVAGNVAPLVYFNATAQPSRFISLQQGAVIRLRARNADSSEDNVYFGSVVALKVH